MLKIGEFSKLSLLTIKTLRYYEKEGILIPTATDEYTRYRYYEVSQLQTAAKIKAYRAMKLSIEEIKAIFAGTPEEEILLAKAQQLKGEQEEIAACLSKINYILEGQRMKYEAEIKNIPGAIVYYTEKRLEKITDKMEFIPWCGAQCLKLNPNLQATKPEYEFIEYLEDTYKEEDVLIRHCEAVNKFGIESDVIKFKEIMPVRVISIKHKGAYETIGEAFAFLMNYAEQNHYTPAGLIRECYIDGIWNKASVEDWLTEIQLPIKE